MARPVHRPQTRGAAQPSGQRRPDSTCRAGAQTAGPVHRLLSRPDSDVRTAPVEPELRLPARYTVCRPEGRLGRPDSDVQTAPVEPELRLPARYTVCRPEGRLGRPDSDVQTAPVEPELRLPARYTVRRPEERLDRPDSDVQTAPVEPELRLPARYTVRRPEERLSRPDSDVQTAPVEPELGGRPVTRAQCDGRRRLDGSVCREAGSSLGHRRPDLPLCAAVPGRTAAAQERRSRRVWPSRAPDRSAAEPGSSARPAAWPLDAGRPASQQ